MKKEKMLNANEIAIRGNLIKKYKHDDKTTIVICSVRNKHKNYQYVTFFGEEKEFVDNLEDYSRVIVTASAWSFRDNGKKYASTETVRLRGKTIKLANEIERETLLTAESHLYGVEFHDYVRFSFTGSIYTITETKNGYVYILLSVTEPGYEGFSLVPVVYNGNGDEKRVKEALAKYKKRQNIHVEGLVFQKIKQVEENFANYINTFYVNSIALVE